MVTIIKDLFGKIQIQVSDEFNRHYASTIEGKLVNVYTPKMSQERLSSIKDPEVLKMLTTPSIYIKKMWVDWYREGRSYITYQPENGEYGLAGWKFIRIDHIYRDIAFFTYLNGNKKGEEDYFLMTSPYAKFYPAGIILKESDKGELILDDLGEPPMHLFKIIRIKDEKIDNA